MTLEKQGWQIMIYARNITTPKDTPSSSLKKTLLKVSKGLVYKVEFYFPGGSAGLMGVAVFDGLYQVWPSTVGEFFIGEDQTITFEDMYLKETPPFEFQCYTYNEDDTYKHLVAVRIGLVSSDVFMARFMPTRTRESFVKMRMQMQEERKIRAASQKRKLPDKPFEWMLRLGGKP